MAIHRRYRVVYGQITWMLTVILLMTLLGTLSVEAFFVLSVIGLLIVTGLTEPRAVRPGWRRRLRVLLLVGLAGLAYLVGRRALRIISELAVLG